MSQLASELTDLIRRADRILIPMHVDPDGDSVGSVLAMGWACQALGKSVTLVGADPVPQKYRFLAGTDQIQQMSSAPEPFDLLLLLDCSTVDRIGAARQVVDDWDRLTIAVVDHHPGVKPDGDWHWIDPEMAATAEMIFDWFEWMDLTPTPGIASAMYTAIATDTGFFAYSNTTAATFRRVAALVDQGASPHRVYEEVHERRRLSAVKLQGRAIENLQLSDGGRLAWSVLTPSEFQASEAAPEDSDGLINALRAIDSIEVAILFSQLDFDDKIKVSFRSRGGVDVGALAADFGGGGHAKAAGAHLQKELDVTVKQVLAAARQALIREGHPS